MNVGVVALLRARRRDVREWKRAVCRNEPKSPIDEFSYAADRIAEASISFRPRP